MQKQLFLCTPLCVRDLLSWASPSPWSQGCLRKCTEAEQGEQVLFSYLLITYADNMALPAFACRWLLLQQSIDISCPRAVGLLLWAHAGTDRRTVPFQRPCSAYYAGSANRWMMRSSGTNLVYVNFHHMLDCWKNHCVKCKYSIV